MTVETFRPGGTQSEASSFVNSSPMISRSVCWLTCRGRARWCGLWHVSRFWRSSGYIAPRALRCRLLFWSNHDDLLQSSGLVKVHGVFQSSEMSGTSSRIKKARISSSKVGFRPTQV